MNFWKKLPLWAKIAFLVIILVLVLLAFLNRPLLLDILRWLGIFWRAETAIIAWRTLEYSFWGLLLIRSLLDFWGLFLAWWLTGLTMKGADTLKTKKGILGRLLQNFEKQNQNPKFKKRLAWLEKKGNAFLYAIMGIGFYIPFLPTAIMIIARIRKIKHGLVIFGLINLARNTILLWCLWQGISLFK